LFIAKEFLNAKKLRTLQGAKINSSRRAGVEQIFAWKRRVVLGFWLKFQ